MTCADLPVKCLSQFWIVRRLLYLYDIVRVSRDSVVGIATGYRLDYRGVGVPVLVGSRIFSSPSCPDWLWGPSSLVSKEYRGFLPGSKAAGV
jgi:hypothetical protein